MVGNPGELGFAGASRSSFGQNDPQYLGGPYGILSKGLIKIPHLNNNKASGYFALIWLYCFIKGVSLLDLANVY